MHPIKTRFLRFQTFALGLIVASSLLAQPAPQQRGANPRGPDQQRGNNPTDPQPKAALSLASTLRSGESRELSDAKIELAHRLAADGDQHPQVLALRERIAMLEKLEPKKISIDFPGGPIGKFVDLVSAIDGVSFSIVNTGEQAEFTAVLPPFSVRNATLATVIEIVRNLLDARGFNLNLVGREPNSVICTLQRRGPPEPKSPAHTEFESFQLAPFLGQQSVEDIIGAIRTAWELDPIHDRDALRLKFHPPTSILLVSGPQDGIWLTRNVLNQLKPAPGKDASPDRKPKGPPPAENDKR